MRSCQGKNAVVTGNFSHPTADEVNISKEEAGKGLKSEVMKSVNDTELFRLAKTKAGSREL